MPISQEGENAKIPKRDFVPGGHYAKITKRERVQEGVIAKVFEGVIVLVGDYSRGCTCQALQEGENARGAKMLGGRVSVSLNCQIKGQTMTTFTTLRDCDLKLWVDIVEQLTVGLLAHMLFNSLKI